MGKDPVIVDVGSNKGEWAEYLGQTCKEVHLFEPNEVLLHYTMVKFDEWTNVIYHPYAVFSKTTELDFFYFTNSNNGLSSVFKNQKWIDAGLPMKFGKTKSVTLDSVFGEYPTKPATAIDSIKIDVEGADYDVLKGAEWLLMKKLIKFIQVEHSEHLKLSGHTWDDILELVREYGYEVYDFDGARFFKAEKWESENYYIMDAEITQNWNQEFIKNTEFLKKGVEFALEIGCFEGLTTRYICDELLSPGGRMIAIDPLTDEYLTAGDEKTKNEINAECAGMFTGQYGRFIRNTKGYPVELKRGTSREIMHGEFMHYRFNFIYVDGDHRQEEVYNDGILALVACRKGGYILFDDYGWREDTARGIDRFIEDHLDYVEVVSRGYQVLVRKFDNPPMTFLD